MGKTRIFDLHCDTLDLGSDYDGCDVPSWLNPCSKVADLVALLEGHFGEGLAHKICYQNVHDFFARIDAG